MGAGVPVGAGGGLRVANGFGIIVGDILPEVGGLRVSAKVGAGVGAGVAGGDGSPRPQAMAAATSNSEMTAETDSRIVDVL